MSRWIVHLLVAALAAVAMLPLVWLVYSSLHSGGVATTANYRDLLGRDDFAGWLANSLLASGAQTALAALISSAAGYALAKGTFVGRPALQIALLVTLLVPPQVLLPGSYELMRTLGWVDRFAAVILPGAVSVFGLFLYRQAMLGVSDDLLDAARLDGAGEINIWWNLALPLLRPVTAAFTLMSFLASWNSLLWPQLMLIDPRRHTLPIAMANLSGLAGFQQNPGLLMAGVVLGVLPIVILFAALQSHFVEGLASGSLTDS